MKRTSENKRRYHAEEQKISGANVDLALGQHFLQDGDTFGTAQQRVECRDPAQHFVAQQGDVDWRLVRFLRGRKAVAKRARLRLALVEQAQDRKDAQTSRPRTPAGRWRSASVRPPSCDSKIEAARRQPAVASRSAKRGRMPVARNDPRTRPASSIPVRSKTKMSCMEMTSHSMPGNFGNGEHLARAVGQACDLHHRMNGGCDLLAHRLLREYSGWPSPPCSRCGPAHRARSWRGRSSAILRGRYSWPEACRRLLRRAPRPRRCGRDAYEDC